MPQHLEEKQVHLIKKGKCFNCKKRSYTIHDYSRKRKIAAILKGISKDNNS